MIPCAERYRAVTGIVVNTEKHCWGVAMTSRIGKYLTRAVKLPTLDVHQQKETEEGVQSVLSGSRRKFWTEKIDNVYTNLLRTDFGKLLPRSRETLEQIEKRHGANLINRLNAEPLVLSSGTKVRAGDVLLNALGISDPDDFRLNPETKKKIDNVDLQSILDDLVQDQLSQVLPAYDEYQKQLPAELRTTNLTCHEESFIRQCWTYAVTVGETTDSAFALANTNLLRVREVAKELNLSEVWANALMVRLNRSADITKCMISPQPDPMNRIGYGVFLRVQVIGKELRALQIEKENQRKNSGSLA
jgi:hypothetical protein